MNVKTLWDVVVVMLASAAISLHGRSAQTIPELARQVRGWMRLSRQPMP